MSCQRPERDAKVRAGGVRASRAWPGVEAGGGGIRAATSTPDLDLLIDQGAKRFIIETFDFEGEAFPRR
jgi:hypothetical protein